MLTTTLRVAEIHCDGCRRTIGEALGRLPGVAHVVASVERNDVRVSFDEARVGEDALRARLAEVGFPPVA